MRPLHLLLLPVLLGATPALPAAAEAAVCPSVFVPEGYDLRCAGADDVWRLEVTPEADPLAGFSRLTVRPIEEPVEDPFSWLQEQLVVDLNGLRFALDEALEDPRNPLAGMFPKEVLEPLLEQLSLLGHLPLQGCAYPFELEQRPVWQIDCSWELGPLRQLARLQLVDHGDGPLLVTIWTLSPKRLRHLQAIANSLEWRT